MDDSVSDAALYQVIRTDEDTLLSYINSNSFFDTKIVEWKEVDGGTQYNYIQKYTEDGQEISFIGQAILYKDTNIAVIEGLTPEGYDNVKVVYGEGTGI